MTTEQPQLSLTYLLRRPAPSDTPPPLLILLHGVGSHEADLFGLAPYLDARFTVVSVRAPVTLPQGGFGWYPVRFTPQGAIADPETALESQRILNGFIGEVPAALGTDPARIYLMGFSQGAIMSLNTLLTTPELSAGVVAMSGRLLPALKDTWAEPARLKDFPVLVVHGLYDQVLPIADGRAIRETLSNLPVDLTYREYPMGHEVSNASLADINTWLTARLDAPGTG